MPINSFPIATRTVDFQSILDAVPITPLDMDLAALGGLEQDFTIPSGVTQIDVAFESIGRTGTTDSLLRLGDASSVKTSGYTGGVKGVSNSNKDDGALICASAATTRATGMMRLRKVSGFIWMIEGQTFMRTFTQNFNVVTRIELASELTTVRLTAATGVWDNGNAVAYMR